MADTETGSENSQWAGRGGRRSNGSTIRSSTKASARAATTKAWVVGVDGPF